LHSFAIATILIAYIMEKNDGHTSRKGYAEGLEKVKKCLLILVPLAVCGSALAAAPDSPSPIQKLREYYKEQYPFFEMADTLYTPQSELQLPEGFSWPDSADLTPFQYWVNHFPVWHQYKGVGIWNGGVAWKFDQITRCVHLPWKGPAYRDFAFPWRIAMEYLRYTQAESLFTFIPDAGTTVTYGEYLKHSIAYGPRFDVKLLPDTARTPSIEEYYKCFGVAVINTNYRNLIANCDTVAVSDLSSGDLFLASDTSGRKGVAYVVLFTVMNKDKERLYAVATGGDVASDFHIPLFNNDRNRPWITSEQIRALAPEGSVQSGFYRMSMLKTVVGEKQK
jgi:hypothetical protein